MRERRTAFGVARELGAGELEIAGVRLERNPPAGLTIGLDCRGHRIAEAVAKCRGLGGPSVPIEHGAVLAEDRAHQLGLAAVVVVVDLAGHEHGRAQMPAAAVHARDSRGVQDLHAFGRDVHVEVDAGVARRGPPRLRAFYNATLRFAAFYRGTLAGHNALPAAGGPARRSASVRMRGNRARYLSETRLYA